MSELDIFKGSRVLVTGHTGFKGSWLSFWLELLGAQVYGLSLDVPTSPSHFEHLGLGPADGACEGVQLAVGVRDANLV